MADERGVVAAAAARRAGDAQLDVAADLLGELREPALEVRAGAGEALHRDLDHAAGAVVLVEEGLEPLDDLGVVLGEGARAVQPLLLAAPVAGDDGALGVRVGGLQDPHRLHHDDGAGAVVGGAGGAVPRVEVGGEEDVLVGQLGAADRRDGVVHGHLGPEPGAGVEAELRALAVLGEAEDEAVILAGEVE